MYYINCFFIYSFLGFIFENIIGVITNNVFDSGILYGPITPIYGIGCITILFISKHLFKRLHLPRWIETFIVSFLLIIILTLLEFIGGFTIESLFSITFWDYSDYKYNLGKYISLEISIFWGILAIILIYIIHPLLHKLIVKIPHYITYITMFIFIIDIAITVITKT